MKSLRISFLFSLFFLFFFVELSASTRVSLLTSMPSDKAVYTLWGHSAIRIQTDEVDVVYNYGVFSFSDNFIYKFVKGETDYWLDWSSMRYALKEVAAKNTYMYEQELDMSDAEADSLYVALRINELEDNKYYRYNFFYDNCATRPRNIIEKVLGDIVYAEVNNTKTYRSRIHQMMEKSPWLALGIDMCLGRETDEVITDYGLTFLPEELMRAYDLAHRGEGDNLRPLVKKKNILSKPVIEGVTEPNMMFCPNVVLWVFFLLVFVYTIWQKKKKDYSRVFDYLFFGVIGLFGALLFFLTFFSDHPCTGSNANLFWCNPFYAILPWIVSKQRNGLKDCIIVAIVCLMCFIPLICIVTGLLQWFNIAIVPLVCIEIVRMLSWVNCYKKDTFLSAK